jgi:hypothetical protein
MRFSKLIIKLIRCANKLDLEGKFRKANLIDNYLKILAEDYKNGTLEKDIDIEPEDILNIEINCLDKLAAEYQGKEVNLDDPIRNPSGSRKKFHVFVKDPKTDQVKKIQFGEPKMEIKRDNPKNRKSFRARHKCDEESAKDKMTPKYWSCYQWRKNNKVDN